MVDNATANARLASYTTFMGGISVIILLLSINILSARDNQLTLVGLFAEAVNVIFLLTAIMLLYLSAATLVSAFFEKGVGLDLGVRRARRMLVSTVFLTFWALSALLLVAFDFRFQAILYALAALAAPVVFLALRRLQGIEL